MKRLVSFVALVLFVTVAPLAGCGGPEYSKEGEGAKTVEDPASVMNAAGGAGGAPIMPGEASGGGADPAGAASADPAGTP